MGDMDPDRTEQSASASADQIAWVEISEVIRTHLLKKAEKLNTMSLTEVRDFINVVSNSLSLDHNARCFDTSLERFNDRPGWCR